MLDAWTPALLRRAAPEARLLVLLRDPVERFRSGTTLAENRFTVGSTARAAANAAFNRGLYADQLLRLWQAFPREQVLVLQYERCVADPRGELARTYAFIGLAPDVPRVVDPAARVNESPGPKVALSDWQARPAGAPLCAGERAACGAAAGPRPVALARTTMTLRSRGRGGCSCAARGPGTAGAARKVLGPPAPPACPAGWHVGPPDYVGLGAQKAGTSWWDALIGDHPDVHRVGGVPKELHYFDQAWEEALSDADLLPLRALLPAAARRHRRRMDARLPHRLLDAGPDRPCRARRPHPHPAARPARAFPLRSDPPARDTRARLSSHSRHPGRLPARSLRAAAAPRAGGVPGGARPHRPVRGLPRRSRR